ncbi:MAG TPA: EscU/YscU/HrcU family type III secretion system export apparatus switch protein [Bryobacteraceae bacterium]|nr:EscU/YscU/HrcU family type III secretion system export apparatus switch protein [Bryobacteraceae bacterium]
MAEQRTEQPTKRRVDRARREGNFAVSREFISAVHFAGFVTLAVCFSGIFVMRLARIMRILLARAFDAELTAPRVVALFRDVVLPSLEPALAAAAGLVVLAILAQLATTRMGISISNLAPNFKRLNFLKNISNLPARNLPSFLQALALLPLVALLVYYEATENLGALLDLSWMGPQVAAARIGAVVETLLWRASGLFLVAGFIELIWQRRRYTNQLRMTKQELRDEAKETDGNPQTKMRVRRIQRDLFRRQMMKEIPKATAVIVNPTHFAVAIRYLANAPGAPKVIAKGKNYLALRIRQRAIEHQIPIIENPPLAQALYKSVEVGQEIPGHLYRAVAEILAYIYRLMGGHLPGQ